MLELNDDADMAKARTSPVSELRIVSVNVATPSVLLEWPRGDVISSIDKRPVDADEQADTRPTPWGGQVHGGVHQAVYAFPAEHYPRLEALLERSLHWGFMGENVTLCGATEHGVCVERRAG